MTPEARTPEERASEDIEVELPHDATAAGLAREAVRDAFVRWGLEILLDDAELAVSELVTNAFKHGLPPVRLTLCQREGCVRVDVTDTRPATATLEWPVVSLETDESGRGRAIVEAVSDESGTEALREGKSSFASWHVDPHTPSAG